MLLKSLRWLYGYVSFKVSGGFPEKFINSVAKDKLSIWDLKKSCGELHAKILASEYKYLRKKSRKSNSKIRITKKYGWPFLAFKYKKRIGIVVGIIIFFGIMQYFSMFVWRINIAGNEQIPSEEILSVMKDSGINIGSKKSKINAAVVKQTVMSKLTDISWISMNLTGSCLNVTVKEKIKSPDIVKEGEPCNLIAQAEGQIDHTEIYKGTLCVKEGDAVLKGQILVSGSVDLGEGNVCLVAADGKVFAQTKRHMQESVKLNQLNAKDTDKVVKKYKINAFGKEVFLTPWRKTDEQYRIEEFDQKLSIFGIELPINFHTDLCYYQECDEKILSTEEAQSILENVIKERERTELSNVKIISKNVDNYEKDNEYVSSITYVCVEDIAKKENLST